MELNGSFSASAEKDKIISMLSNPREFSKCVPNVSEVEVNGNNFDMRFKIDASKYTGKFLGASYLSSINVKFNGSITYDPSNSTISISGGGSAVGIKFSIVISLVISEKDNLTYIDWKAEINIGGFAKLFGESMMNQAMNENVNQIISCIKKRLEGASP
ncbi:MAG: SRPBCC domain-containing protein [Candidatus Parvarchaeota archaeon]|nr:SRPBCC domain-containing protein [Candidatus Parvarchaeota archaeon]